MKAWHKYYRMHVCMLPAMSCISKSSLHVCLRSKICRRMPKTEELERALQKGVACLLQLAIDKQCLHVGGYTVPRGQDVMISVYNIHHSPAVWDDAEAFRPERFSLDTPTPNEQNTDYRYIALTLSLTSLAVGIYISCLSYQYCIYHIVL